MPSPPTLPLLRGRSDLPRESLASHFLIAATLLLVLAPGCTPNDATPEPYAVRDSLGISIVESREPAWLPGEAWILTPEPELHLGVPDGADEYQFTTIGGVWQQDDGTIVVADGRTAQIRRYDASGQFIDRWGGVGDGPGEFQGLIQALPYRGDSILAQAGGRRVIFGPEGGMGRSIEFEPFEFETIGDRQVPLVARGITSTFADGSFLITSSAFRIQGDPGATYMEETGLMRLPADAGAWEEIGRFPGPERYVSDFTAGSALLTAPFTVPFVAVGSPDAVYIGSDEGFEILKLSPEGATELLIRSAHLDRTATEEDRAGFREYARGVAEVNNRDPAALERELLGVEYPELIPPFSQFLVDAEGYLWVRHYKMRWSAGPEQWSVFAPEGFLLGTVSTPERLQVRQIGPDFILGIWTDELEVRYVRRYELDRR